MITGKIKFFEENQISINTGARAVDGDGNPANELLSDSNETRWTGTTTRPLISIIINKAFRANRIIVIDSNADALLINDFRGRLTLRGPVRGEGTKYNTDYFDFDEQEFQEGDVIGIQFSDGTVDQKPATIKKIIMTTEIGTLEGWPQISSLRFSDNAKVFKSKSGQRLISKQQRTLENLTLSFKNYTKQNDIELVHTLHRREDPLLIWPSGGREEQFRYIQEGLRNQDIYRVQSSGRVDVRLNKGSYSSLMDSSLTFHESI